MTIQNFPSTVAGEAAANAVVGPKNVLFTGAGFEVRTDADYNIADLIPKEVSRAQGLMALNAAGLYNAVNTYIATAPIPQQIAFTSAMWQRNSPSLNAAATALGMSAAQLDALFTAAASIIV